MNTDTTIKEIKKEIEKSSTQWRLSYKLLLGSITALSFVVSVLYHNELNKQADHIKELERQISRWEKKDNDCDERLMAKDRVIDSTRAYFLKILLDNSQELQDMKNIQKLIMQNPIKLKNQIRTVSKTLNKIRNEKD